jgi:hypothetical protein
MGNKTGKDTNLTKDGKVEETSMKSLETCSDEDKKNFHIVLSYVKQDGLQLQWASPELRLQHDIVVASLEQNPLALQYANEGFQDNKMIVRPCVLANCKCLRFASKELRNDKALVMEAIEEDTEAFDYCSVELRRDVSLLEHVQKNWKGVMIPTSISRDKKNAMTCIKKLKWSVLFFLCDELKEDKEIVLAAIQENWREYKFASSEMKNNREILLETLKKAVSDRDGIAMSWCGEDLMKDTRFALDAFKVNPYVFRYSPSLQSNKTIALDLMGKEGLMLEFGSEEVRNDETIAKVAIMNNPLSFEFVGSELKQNVELCTLSVQKNGDLLKFVPESLKTRDLVMAATITTQTALNHVPKDILENDKEFVLKTVEFVESILLYISKYLSQDV